MTALKAIERAGWRVDALDERPQLPTDLHRVYSLIVVWCLGRRDYSAGGAPMPVPLATIQGVYDSYELRGRLPFSVFAQWASAMDRVMLDHYATEKA